MLAPLQRHRRSGDEELAAGAVKKLSIVISSPGGAVRFASGNLSQRRRRGQRHRAHHAAFSLRLYHRIGAARTKRHREAYTIGSSSTETPLTIAAAATQRLLAWSGIATAEPGSW